VKVTLLKILIIIPAYNEERNIQNLIRDLLKFDQYNVDLLIINDFSTDRTSDVCKNLGLKVIDLPCNLGIGGAVQTGYKYARQHNYDIAIQVDGDGQHKPTYLGDLIRPLVNEKADMVIGSRYIEKKGFQSSFTRRIGIKYFSRLIQLLTKQKISDPTSGFRACNSKVIALFANRYPKDYPEPESLVYLNRNNISILEVPVVMQERINGKSSINAARSVYYVIKVSLAVIIDRLRKQMI
jgi:glycosyltransferase involved in cell wall biosynthesis